MVEVIDYPNGICPKHGPKLSVNGVPQCVRCTADAEAATRAPRPVVVVEDPGHEAMSKIVPGGKPTTALPAQAPAGKAAIRTSGPVPVSLLEIRDAIYRLQMPKSLKQYKRFLKIQQLIDQAVEDENAEAD